MANKKKSLSKKTAKIAKAVNKEQVYLDSLDLNSLWEEFANSFNGNGTPKYKTAWSFVVAKEKKDKAKQKMLYWILGPKVELLPGQVAEYGLPQFDFEVKRKQGFWYSSDNIEKFKLDVQSKASAYDAIKQAGRVNLDTIGMLNRLSQQLDDEFGGRLFLDNLSMKENAMRSQLYMQLLGRVLELMNSAQLMFARSQGLDLERLDQFFQLFGNQIGKTAAMVMGTRDEDVDETELGHHRAMKNQFAKVVDMVANKAMEYSLPLPDDLKAAVEVTTAPSKKAAKPN